MKLKHVAKSESVGNSILDLRQGQMFIIVGGTHNADPDRVHIKHTNNSEWLCTVISGDDPGNQYFWAKGNNGYMAHKDVMCELIEGKLKLQH